MIVLQQTLLATAKDIVDRQAQRIRAQRVRLEALDPTGGGQPGAAQDAANTQNRAQEATQAQAQAQDKPQNEAQLCDCIRCTLRRALEAAHPGVEVEVHAIHVGAMRESVGTDFDKMLRDIFAEKTGQTSDD
jgi:hypothetical protein